METSARLLNVLIRVCGGTALALGLAFWMGYARSFTRLHIALGVALVVGLWALAAMAWTKGVRRDLAIVATAFGLFGWYFGMNQGHLLPGSLHWVVRLAHLIIGVIMVGLGARLAGALAVGRTTSAPPTARASL